MAASLSDSNMLSTDPTFQGRVRAGMISTAIAVNNEAWTVPFHRERQTYAVSIINQPDVYKLLFVNVVANDPIVMADATQAGTVVLTSGNVATQQALVTDAHISSACNGQYNSFFRTPAQ